MKTLSWSTCSECPYLRAIQRSVWVIDSGQPVRCPKLGKAVYQPKTHIDEDCPIPNHIEPEQKPTLKKGKQI